jgi:hypothetical protein
MNVSRNRRRLIAARRYAYRWRLERIDRTGILFPPIWSRATTSLDSDSALRAAGRLAALKYSHARHWAAAEAKCMDDGFYCSVVEPCGGCSSCVYVQCLYAASGHREDSVAARIRLNRRIDPGGMRFIADLGYDV